MDKGIVDAKFLTTVRDGAKIETTMVVLSFPNPTLPLKCSWVSKLFLFGNTIANLEAYCTQQPGPIDQLYR